MVVLSVVANACLPSRARARAIALATEAGAMACAVRCGCALASVPGAVLPLRTVRPAEP